MEKLFVIWAQGGEGAATGDGVLVGEVVGTEPHSRSHGLEFRHAGQSVFRFEELSRMEGLQDARLVSEFSESYFKFGFPFVLGMICGDHDTSRAPCLFGKPTDFEKSQRVVMKGSMVGETFECQEIILKCPSKYTDEKGPGAPRMTTETPMKATE